MAITNEERLQRLEQDASHELATWQNANRKLLELQSDPGATEGEIHAQERLCSGIGAKVNALYQEAKREERRIAYLAAWKAQYRR